MSGANSDRAGIILLDGGASLPLTGGGAHLVYSGVIILEKIFAFFVEFSQIYKSSIGFLVLTFIFDHHGGKRSVKCSKIPCFDMENFKSENETLY